MTTWTVYDKWKLGQFKGVANTVVDFDTDTIKCMLVTRTFTPAQASDDFKNTTGMTTNEVSGTNYTAGGATLGSLSVTVASHVVTWTCANITWSQNAAGFANARYAILYKRTGTDSTRPVVAYYDLGSNVGNVAGDLTLQIDAAGIFTVT